MMENSDEDLWFDAVSCPEELCSSSPIRSLSSPSCSFGPNNHPDSSKISPDQSGLEGIEGHEKSSNDGTKDAVPDIFGIPVILNHVLQHFSNSKLLKFSLVSKLWKKEARSVMKKRDNLMALLKCDGSRGCGEVFEAFAANLETLNEGFYSGMTIALKSQLVGHCEGTGSVELEAIHESILAKMRGKLKRLTIRLANRTVSWNNLQNCLFFLLLRLLLSDFAGDLEHLTLEMMDDMEPFIQEFLPPGPYPKLKELKLCYFASFQQTFCNQIRMFLSRAPNLKKIHTYGRFNLREKLTEGREEVVHVHESHVDNPMRDISDNVIPALRLEDMTFSYTSLPKLGLGRFNEKAQSLLRTCCARTLVNLELDTVSAVLLMSYGIQLKNVTGLSLRFDYPLFGQFEPRIMSFLSRLDFTYLFPNLKGVTIFMPDRNLVELPRDIMDAIFEQASAVLMEPTLRRAENIQTLAFDREHILITDVQFFAHMFPAIEELEIYRVDEEDEVFDVGSAWELWPDLKLIEVVGERYERP